MPWFGDSPEGFSLIQFLFVEGHILEIFSAVFAISTLGLTFVNTQHKNEIRKAHEEIEHLKQVNLRIDGKVNPESDRQLILKAKKSLQLLGINNLRVFHHSREEIVDLLVDRKGQVQVLLLNPDSQTFRDREKFEKDLVGRIRSEWNASLKILQGIKLKVGGRGKIELKLWSDRLPDRSLLIVDALGKPEETSSMMINYYPKESGIRGYLGGSFLAEYNLVRDRDSYETNCTLFDELWEDGVLFDLDQLDVGGVLSCMDAPENARTFERISRIRIAVMYPACLRSPLTAGLDGIRLLKGQGRDAPVNLSSSRLGQNHGLNLSWLPFSPSRSLFPRTSCFV